VAGQYADAVGVEVLAGAAPTQLVALVEAAAQLML